MLRQSISQILFITIIYLMRWDPWTPLQAEALMMIGPTQLVPRRVWRSQTLLLRFWFLKPYFSPLPRLWRGGIVSVPLSLALRPPRQRRGTMLYGIWTFLPCR